MAWDVLIRSGATLTNPSGTKRRAFTFGELYWVDELAWKKCGWIVVPKRTWQDGELVSEANKERPGLVVVAILSPMATLAPCTTDRNNQTIAGRQDWELFSYGASEVDWGLDSRAHFDAVAVLTYAYPIRPEHIGHRAGNMQAACLERLTAAWKQYIKLSKGMPW